ncbi:hypothetical protein B4135_3924 [Caldibacillus debilis]|uniref:Uncharacterized protein n=1 Tax=Caldibacillus debilis TaxID=301148 RepID=A0A150L9I8_9BACI|nr:hypothetical protein B4135_3924 [Caldibacillus debilis]
MEYYHQLLFFLFIEILLNIDIIWLPEMRRSFPGKGNRLFSGRNGGTKKDEEG